MFDWFIAFLTDYLNTVSPAELLVLVLIIVVIAGLIGGKVRKSAMETVKMEITMGDCPYRASDFPIYVAPRNTISTCAAW